MARTVSKEKVEWSGWVGVFGGEAGKVSVCDFEGLFLAKLDDKQAKRLGEAGGAEGSVGDGGVGSATV